MTPLIDVVFILLIFVVLMANFERIKGLKVQLPEASSSDQVHKKALVVSISANGQIEVQAKSVEAPGLLPLLRQLRKTHDVLILRADSSSALQHAVLVLDYAATLRFTSVSIATRKPKSR
jgi:biopolymer transport protein ExbD